MHIVLHTQYYPPEIGAPQARLHELAVGLVGEGIQVTVLTAMPSYPRGRIYAGYPDWFCEEYLQGVRVIRTAIFPTQSAGMLPRMLSYFSFMLSSLLIGSWHIVQADFVLTESPPLFLGLAGLILSVLKRARWIFNISDLWPESVVELGLLRRDSLGYKLSSTLEQFLYKKAWIVTGQSKTILEHIQGRFPDIQVRHLPNGVDTSFFHPGDAKLPNKSFHIVYAGLHGLAQGLDQIALAAAKLPSMAKIDFTFVGDGPEKRQLIQMAANLNLDSINFLEPVPKKGMPEILRTADALLVPLKIQLTGAVPSKLYEAMSMEKPIILIAESEAARIVTDAHCGIVVRPGDIEGLVDAMIYLQTHPEVCKQMGANGRRISVQNHDRAQITEQFSKFLFVEHSRNQ